MCCFPAHPSLHLLSVLGLILTLCCVGVPANRGVSPGPSEESAAPVRRSRRRVVKDASVAPHVSTFSHVLHTVRVF